MSAESEDTALLDKKVMSSSVLPHSNGEEIRSCTLTCLLRSLFSAESWRSAEMIKVFLTVQGLASRCSICKEQWKYMLFAFILIL